MQDTVTQRLSDKLHALWDSLDAEEQRLFALAARADEEEVAGYAAGTTLFTLLPVLQTGFTDMTLHAEASVSSVREAGSGMATGRRQYEP